MPTWIRKCLVLQMQRPKCRFLGYARCKKCVLSFRRLLVVSLGRVSDAPHLHKPQRRLGDMMTHLSTSRSSVPFEQLRLTKLQEVSSQDQRGRSCVHSPRIERKISHNCCGALPSDSRPSDLISTSFTSSNSRRPKHKEESKRHQLASCWQTLLPDILGQLPHLCPIVSPSPVAWPVPQQRNCDVRLRSIVRRSESSLYIICMLLLW